MNWTEIAIETNPSGIEPLTGILLNIGITGVQVENSDDFNEFLEGTEIYWDYVDESLMYLKDAPTRVIFYLPENAQGMDMFSELKNILNELKKENKYGPLSLTMNNVKDEDWENNWKQFFKPIKIGSKFLIKPSWENVSDTEDRHILEIDPGMSFGTGTHETTRLCLETMEKCDIDNKEVLDLGCGSGILSIGALLLGAKHVNMVDIDENSVKIAKENTALNGFDDSKYQTFCGNITENKTLCDTLGYNKYDVIFANIVADVIKAMSSYFGQFLKDDGTLIVSGIITERKEEVMETLMQNGFKVIESFEDGSWSSMLLKKDL